MFLTSFMALMAMFLFSPCTAFPQSIPRPLVTDPTNRHGRGQVLPPVPPYHVSPVPPAAPTTSPVWYVPPPVQTSQSPPPPIFSYPEIPRPNRWHPIPRHRFSPPPPSVSGNPLPPTPNPTDPALAPPNNAHLPLTAPAQPPISVPHSQFPPHPKRHQFPPHRQFPPHHGWIPTLPSN